ncbi:hypothetical protein M231_04049 [Tremella mesenterica]|uniref:DUF4211 domain-containing protein n=1 Tax=Tremella mesenterica TaxID=5217 RepID=A0A4Q1BLR7_TREME|nr:hypothetical protein M231_04049 [Tremella mesenterica]
MARQSTLDPHLSPRAGQSSKTPNKSPIEAGPSTRSPRESPTKRRQPATRRYSPGGDSEGSEGLAGVVLSQIKVGSGTRGRKHLRSDSEDQPDPDNEDDDSDKDLVGEGNDGNYHEAEGGDFEEQHPDDSGENEVHQQQQAFGVEYDEVVKSRGKGKGRVKKGNNEIPQDNVRPEGGRKQIVQDEEEEENTRKNIATTGVDKKGKPRSNLQENRSGENKNAQTPEKKGKIVFVGQPGKPSSAQRKGRKIPYILLDPLSPSSGHRSQRMERQLGISEIEGSPAPTSRTRLATNTKTSVKPSAERGRGKPSRVAILRGEEDPQRVGMSSEDEELSMDLADSSNRSKGGQVERRRGGRGGKGFKEGKISSSRTTTAFVEIPTLSPQILSQYIINADSHVLPSSDRNGIAPHMEENHFIPPLETDQLPGISEDMVHAALFLNDQDDLSVLDNPPEGQMEEDGYISDSFLDILTATTPAGGDFGVDHAGEEIEIGLSETPKVVDPIVDVDREEKEKEMKKKKTSGLFSPAESSLDEDEMQRTIKKHIGEKRKVVTTYKTGKGKEKAFTDGGKSRTKDGHSSKSMKTKDRKGKGKQVDKPSKGQSHREKGHKNKSSKRSHSSSPEDMVEDLKLDEPERFKSSTRLRERVKETVFQRKMRHLRARRLGLEESSSSSESSTSDDSEEDDDDDESESDEEDFIIDDGGHVPDDLLPHQFSLNSAQTPEFKLKVVFQYFVLLAVKGPKILPLKGDAAGYLLPQLEDQRRKMTGYREGRVRSQIWPSRLVKALERYPVYRAIRLDHPTEHCDACNRSNYKSVIQINLDGDDYDRNNYEPLDSDSDSDSKSESESSSSIDSEDKLPKELFMGTHCHKRTEVYHKMCHWELDLFQRIRQHHRDLLRARRLPVPSDSEASSSASDPDSDPEEVADRRASRERRRAATEKRVKLLQRRGKLPEKAKDVDEVTQWMDEMGYQTRAFRWMESLIAESARLEFDKSTD